MASLGHLDLQGAFVHLDPGLRGIYTIWLGAFGSVSKSRKANSLR
jgi:hypothetical protein